MKLMTRKDFLKQPAGTVFNLYFPEMMVTSGNAADIQHSAFDGFCIKGETEGETFSYTNLAVCRALNQNPENEAEWKQLAEASRTHEFKLDVSSSHQDIPSALHDTVDGKTRALYAVRSLDEVDALVKRLQSALDHMRTSLGLEI